jgi:hypothetical protein
MYKISFDKENSSPLTQRILTVEEGRKEMNSRVRGINKRKMHIQTTEEPVMSIRLQCEKLFGDDSVLEDENVVLNTQYRELIVEIVQLQSQGDLKSAELKVEELEKGFARQREIIAEQETVWDKIEQLLNTNHE